MNPFVREESLYAVVVVVNDTVFRSIRGDGEDLRILYLGTASNAPANANDELLRLRQEVVVENEPEKDQTILENLQVLFTPPGAPPKPPWIAIVHLTTENAGGSPEKHVWIARDFKEMAHIALKGAPNEGLMIFHADQPDDIDALATLDEIRAIAQPEPDVVFLLTGIDDAGRLGSKAGDYGAAADSDE